MEDLTSKTVAVLSRAFTVPGFAETLPAGDYEIETELASPPDHRDPEAWMSSVLVTLHPRISHPGLARTVTVSLADLDHARARDRLTDRASSDLFLEGMLADPMVRLVMQADGVSEAHLRHLYSGRRTPDPDLTVPAQATTTEGTRGDASIRAVEAEGMRSRSERPSRSRGRDVAGQV